MRPLLIVLTVLLTLVASALVSHVQTAQAQSSAPIKMRRVTSDPNGNMVYADTFMPTTGSVKALSCVVGNDSVERCWAVIQ